MLRSLYRVYLYVVSLAMLLFAAFGLNNLLYMLLLQTPLRGRFENAPGHSQLVQALVLAAVALLTAALIGGIHYWLIRRDIRSDPGAAAGGIRSFFLNFVEAVYLPLAVSVGAFALPALGVQDSNGVAGAVAFAIPALGSLALLEWERRRSQPGPGAPLVFQRLHLYGVQLILFFMLTVSWFSTLGQLFDSIFFDGRGTQTTPCGGFTTCPGSGPNLLSQALSTLTIALFWLGYTWLSRNDSASLIRRVLHLISLGYGIIFVLIAVYRGLELLMLTLFKLPISISDFSGPFSEYDVLSPLSLGALAIVCYTSWLLRAARTQSGTAQATVSLIAQAIAATLTGVTFWYGCGRLVYVLLEHASPSTSPPTSAEWAATFAILLTGSAALPLDLVLRRRSARLGITPPLRGFVFTLLAGGILALSIGGATALYAYATSMLGSPLPNWLHVSHLGSAACIVGAVVTGIYLSISMRERFLKRSPTPAPEQASAQADRVPTQAAPPSVAAIVDALQAGSISRAEAIARLEALLKSPV